MSTLLVFETCTLGSPWSLVRYVKEASCHQGAKNMGANGEGAPGVDLGTVLGGRVTP